MIVIFQLLYEIDANAIKLLKNKRKNRSKSIL